MAFHVIDWFILGGYLVFALGWGYLSRERAGKDLASYFVAGRSMPAWIVGTSMVATTFAADTPLVVTGIVSKQGIAGNWFWWSWAIGHIFAAFVFARWWRRTGVVTDAEFVELRYSGKPAAFLRSFRAFYFAIIINCITMAYVIRAMGKVVRVLFPWDAWLPASFIEPLQASWPTFLAFGPSEAISLVLAMAIATTYATLGGLRAVMLTDVAQFAFAMIGSIALGVAAVWHIGGLGQIPARMSEQYGSEANDILAFWPDANNEWLPLEVFIVYLTVQWWAHKHSDGGGIFMQRMASARTPRDATHGTAWFVLAHYALRPWPWILVGLVALILYPTNQPADGALAALVVADREMAYPVMMAELLPPGLLGIMMTGMAAAFMSTLDTHINWGASYLVRDWYQRRVNPEASNETLVTMSRRCSLFIAVLAFLFTTQVGSIEGAWRLIMTLGSGLGLVSIVRWFWWRINAYGEIAGMIAAGLVATWFQLFDAEAPYHITLLWTAGLSAAAMLTATLSTPACDIAHLKIFHERVQPVGFWRPVRDGARNSWGDASLLLSPIIALPSLGLLLFGIGTILLKDALWGSVLLTLGAIGWWTALRLTDRSHRV